MRAINRIRRLKPNDIEQIMFLDSITDKPLGEEFYIKNITNECKNCSLGLFRNNELVSMIIAINSNNSSYHGSINIFKIAYKYKKSLLALLVKFHSIHKHAKHEFIVCCTDKNINTLKRISEKHGVINIVAQYKNSNNAVDNTTNLVLNFTPKLFNDIKLAIMSLLFEGDAISAEKLYFKLTKKFSLEVVEQNKKYMLTQVHNHYINWLQPSNNEGRFKILIHYKTMLYGTNRKNFIKTLRKNGMKSINSADPLKEFNEEKILKCHNRYKVRKQDGMPYCVEWFKLKTVCDNFPENTLTYYRHIFRRHIIEKYANKKYVNAIYVLDEQYNKVVALFPRTDIYKLIPKIDRRIIDYFIMNGNFITKIQDSIKNEYKIDDKRIYLDRYFLRSIIKIKKLVDEEFALEFYHNFMKKLVEKKNFDEQYKYMHDIFYVIMDILCAKETFLTKSAVKKVLYLNPKKQNELSSLLHSLRNNVREKDKLKAIRKQISKLIKKSESVEPFVRETLAEIEREWLLQNKIEEQHIPNILHFVNSMRRYDNYVSIKSLVQLFGKSTNKVVSGKYKGYFKENYFDIDMKELGQIIKVCLGDKGKNALVKHPFKLYGDLSKIGNVKDMVCGKIAPEMVEPIIHQLRQRKINVPDNIIEQSKLSAKIERKCSPEFLMAGNASVCCMSYGQEKANIYAKEKGFGIFNIYYKDRVIANSLLWVNEPYNCLVIDNIEVHPNYIRFNDFIKILYHQMIEYVLKQYRLSFAVQGCTYNDLKLYNKKDKKIDFMATNPVDVKAPRFYTDAKVVFPIPNNEYSNEDIIEIIKKINIQVYTKKEDSQNEDNELLLF